LLDKTQVQIEKIEETLKPVVKPVASYVYQRRGRFSALATAAALYPWLRRPHHTWSEFEKDFRMYDAMAKPKRKTMK
jgi:hypothetical protein